MTDAVRLGDDQFRRIYDLGFRTWADLHTLATSSPEGPACVADAFLHQPPFPRTLCLKNEYERAFATGSSSWGAGGNACDLPSFCTSVQIAVTRREPVKLSMPATVQDKPSSLFPSRDDNYLAVLMLAWAYVLSARWVDIMPEPCSINYTKNCVPHNHEVTANGGRDSPGAIKIDIAGASAEEARWWVGVLAQDHGWQATMPSGQRTLLSPWSIHLCSTQSFFISTDNQPLASQYVASSASQHVAPSFSESDSYIQRFCERHNIFDQSHAALAAVLLFPSFGSGQELQLPTTRIGTCNRPTKAKTHVQWMVQQRYNLLHNAEYLDKCLTSSCNTKGIRPILFSAFYEPSINCNAVTPWLQGSLAAIDTLVGGKPDVLWRIMAFRAPAAAWLWLGAIALGLQENLLREVGFGQLPIDLTSSAWSGTIQSFMQAPIMNTDIYEQSIERADECKLLILTQSSHHLRFPICQWKPFGSTPLEDADIEVRNHVRCQGHGLRYEGFSWDCTDGKVMHWPSWETRGSLPPRSSNSLKPISVSYQAMIRSNEVISENATRSIFGWLRFDGYAPLERPIWEHEWFAISDSDEDDDFSGSESKSKSNDGATSSLYLKSWISNLPTTTTGDGGLADGVT